jgi:hypothetical protein
MYGKRWGLRPNMVHWLCIRVIRPSTLYAALVWWSKVKQKTTKIQLGRIQRMACLAITWAMKSTPTAGASESDSARSIDHGGGKDGTLQAAYTVATNCSKNSVMVANHLEKCG